ncbi:MAG: hypothetical protein PVH38_09535, partial [Gammaproteobacteria bacterium]
QALRSGRVLYARTGVRKGERVVNYTTWLVNLWPRNPRKNTQETGANESFRVLPWIPWRIIELTEH